MPVYRHASAFVRRFLYRLPRLKAEIPFDLILGDSVVLGLCLDVSESGLRGTFELPVTAGSEGLLTLYREGFGFQTHAVVESVSDDEARIRFLFASDDERLNIRQLVRRLTASYQR